MILLQNGIIKTAAIAEGYKLGTLIIENGKAYVETEDDRLLKADNLMVDILNGREWVRLGKDDYALVTPDGWPLFGGFDCRWKPC